MESQRKTSEPRVTKDDADKPTALPKSASTAGGARPKSSRPSFVQTGSKSRTSTSRRGGGESNTNGDGKSDRLSIANSFSTKADKSAAFSSLLKRAQRCRGGDSRPPCKPGTPDGSDGNEHADGSGGKVVDKSGHAKSQNKAVAATVDIDDAVKGDVVVTRTQVRRDKTKDDVAEYTILARPSKQGTCSASDTSATAPLAKPDVYEQPQETPGALQDLRCKGKIRHGPSDSLDYPCSNPNPSPAVPCSGLQSENFHFPLTPPYESQSISPFFPIHDSNQELSYPRYDTGLMPEVFAGCPQYHQYPPPPSPAVSPPYLPINVTSPFPPQSRRRFKGSCFVRRHPEGRLYDSHGRWIGNERKPARILSAEGTPCEICIEEELQRNKGNERFTSSCQEPTTHRTRTLQNTERRHSSASWSPSTIPDDDIEDLLPLIDKLAMEYPNSDSSTESPVEPQMPDEDTWFSVLPETTKPEDRFIWSPRRDMHRPKSIWSPIKPKLGSCPQDSLQEALARMKYRSRTYTECFPSRNLEIPVGGRRRAISCELPRPDRKVQDEFQASGDGWSPWNCQLPTADLLDKTA